MKPDIRWQALLAVVGFALVAGLASIQVRTASICTTTTPAGGGVFVEGIVGRPLTLNPLLADPYPVDRELVSLIYDGLVSFDEQGNPVPALAREWRYSEDGLTLRFVLRDDAVWHDGRPVTAGDVAFTYGLMQDEAFPGPEALKSLWQSVRIVPVDDRTIDFVLSEPFAPFIEAASRGILPAHALQGVTAADLTTAAFNRRPIGTGPFIVESNQDWERSGRLRLSPNPAHWREGTQIEGIEFRFFADEAAMLSAFAAGEIQAMSNVSPTLLPEVLALPAARVFTSVAPRYTQLLFNLSDTAAPSMRSKEIRQAIAYSLDRENLIDRTLQGQGVALEGPYLPQSPAFNPALLTVYEPQPETAAALLDAAGWGYPPGQTVRSRDGAPLTLRLLALDTPTQRALAEALAGQLQAAGVGTELLLIGRLPEFRQALAERGFDLALVDVAPPHDPDLYDFWSQEAIVRGQNYAGWNNRRASEALEAGRQTLDYGERLPFYETFLRQYDGELPALTLYQHVGIYALSAAVQQAEIGRVAQPRDRYETMADWFLRYREVTVGCPEGQQVSDAPEQS